MSSGLRNFICNVMMALMLGSAVLFVFAFVTYFLGNPFALALMTVHGASAALLFVELRWNPMYSAVAWVGSKMGFGQ